MALFGGEHRQKGHKKNSPALWRAGAGGWVDCVVLYPHTIAKAQAALNGRLCCSHLIYWGSSPARYVIVSRISRICWLPLISRSMISEPV